MSRCQLLKGVGIFDGASSSSTMSGARWHKVREATYRFKIINSTMSIGRAVSPSGGARPNPGRLQRAVLLVDRAPEAGDMLRKGVGKDALDAAAFSAVG
jgi:hypothetical protein